jgi:hypothetical protein
MSDATPTQKPRTVTILVNNRPVELDDREVSGAEIKEAADIPLTFKLYNPKGEEIGNDTRLKIHPKEKFTAISGQDVS